MRGLRLLLVGCLLAALAAPAGATSYRGAAALAGAAMPRAASVGGVCSKATAQQLTPDKVAGVLCGSFLGPGSDTMVLMTTNGTCVPFLGWDLYRLGGGSWQLVQLAGHGGFSGVPVVVVGSDLRETLPHPNPGQPVCLATATKSRIWHWNGTALVPGAWTYKRTAGRPPTAAAKTTVVDFFSPSKNIACEVVNHPLHGIANAGCQIQGPPGSAHMQANDAAVICHGASCLGNFGENAHFRQLNYGQSVTLGRFRCTSAETGITCMDAKTGKGFSVSRQAITRVG